MPIYMDRHDISADVTAENVADLHKEDLKIQAKFNCKGLTYWFDESKKIAFCLIEAPNKDAIHKMHQHAHGEVPNQIIEVDPHLVESFLGRIKDPFQSSPNTQELINESAQRVIMCLRFEPLQLRDLTVLKWKSILQSFLNVLKEKLNKYEGSIGNKVGSQFLLSFKDLQDAISYGQELVKHLKIGKPLLNIKIGLSTGMPLSDGNDLFEHVISKSIALSYFKTNGIILSDSYLINQKGLQKNMPINLSKEDLKILYHLLEFVKKEWQNPQVKVEDFGHTLGLSKTLMYRNMIRLTGKSPNNFLRKYRLDQALDQLTMQEKSLTEIAFESGFNSGTYFSKCFRKQFGTLPSSYLKTFSDPEPNVQ
ncbi:nickel-binding protein [Algoriphagus halophilus]|uniref:AraC-type DNA-binding protein n=1 Tax=Algoriphagus halophilus TaxID=226505 RepID=A0A1N6G557_9BACT|nr:nickel-binding protein [Algoriphagus halophilus]SIO02653.1 AraC-type DNA-binding protein [Algoriphagus halophilus]